MQCNAVQLSTVQYSAARQLAYLSNGRVEGGGRMKMMRRGGKEERGRRRKEERKQKVETMDSKYLETSSLYRTVFSLCSSVPSGDLRPL